MENIGALAVLLALAFSAYAILGSLAGKWAKRPLLALSAERAVYCVWVLLTVAAGILINALITGDFRMSYVTEHSNRTMPTIYKFTAWWGGQGGSLLLWAWLLAARVVQGVGAAFMMPASLALIGAAFSGEARGRAVGTWAAAGAITGALGPLAGGWLIDTVGWRAIFLINLPIAGTAAWLAWTFVEESRSGNPAPLDAEGALLATAGLALLTIGLTVLAPCVVLGAEVNSRVGEGYVARFFNEGLIILGWVANWRPIQIFLYDWWPLARRRQLFRRLARATIDLKPLET